MDVISHGLWGGVLFGRQNKKKFWQAFLIGIAPDMLSFGVFFVVTFFTSPNIFSRAGGPPHPDSIPQYVSELYNITHSLVVFALVFLLLFLIFKKPVWVLMAWGFHIVLDIFTHSFQFFPTPFLWPVSDYMFDGWMWGTPWVFLPNVLLLTAFYIWFFVIKKRRSR